MTIILPSLVGKVEACGDQATDFLQLTPAPAWALAKLQGHKAASHFSSSSGLPDNPHQSNLPS